MAYHVGPCQGPIPGNVLPSWGFFGRMRFVNLHVQVQLQRPTRIYCMYVSFHAPPPLFEERFGRHVFIADDLLTI